jgi:hypothetical protein
MSESASEQSFQRWVAEIQEGFAGSTGDQAFALALGRFVIAFSEAESELYRVLVAYSKTEDSVARALFSGTRAKAMIDFFRSIAHNTAMEPSRVADLELVFAQLAAINAMRDHLIHHASSSYFSTDKKSRLVANVRASRYGNARGYVVDPATINCMTWDLYAITNHLSAHPGPVHEPFAPWREDPDVQSPTAWAYRPLQPVQGWDRTPPKKTPSQGER